MIVYTSENVKVPKLEKRKINAWIKSVAEKYDKKVGEIAYVFCDDAKILEVNQTYLQHDYFTDIITFDYCEGKTLNGDIFISLDTVHSNAQEFEVDFENELLRIMIHGILHLCGQDDKTPEARLEMTHKENDALQIIL
ncbi:MAG TPA: rRNA maturation RNase YbeY [Paludibacteraceae bacterium]|nr:rRNA maturation RNase YbeY [Paludibacteraceae bacterium]HQB69122.1 rRNA maturation RNase YbeY [Paludibacteraceae bacterium]HRS67559.1 rRNA maturation RNase YbeY [Paludibacteraceae bacterium]